MKYLPAILMLLGGLVLLVPLPSIGGGDAAQVQAVDEADIWRDLADRVEEKPENYPFTDTILSVIDRLPLTDKSRVTAWRTTNSAVTAENLKTILYTIRGAPPAPSP